MEKNMEKNIEELIEIVKKLGWAFAIPDSNDNEDVRGMIIGEQPYIDYILKHLD